MDKDKEVIPKEVISPMEEKFESLRNRIGLFLGPLVFVIFYFFKEFPRLKRVCEIRK